MDSMIGKRFGLLLVVEESKKLPNDKHKAYSCNCDCGTIGKIVRGTTLRRGDQLSCGCLKGLSHGMCGTPTYTSWQEMKTRCYNERRKTSADYVKRGIKVCERWENSFENFLADMGERPIDMTLDRKDVNGDYEPSNCRWATSIEQARNTRRNRYVDTPQGKMLMIDAVRASGLSYSTIQWRLNNNWPTDKLFEKPL